jgi:3-oxoacyl-[acyl-carrier protein] reductase
MGNEAFRLDGEVALITGAARGLGRAIAIAMAAAGADVWINDLAETPEAQDTLAAIRAHGRRTGMAVGSVADPDDVQRVVQSVEAEAGKIDILVNNAGISGESPVTDLPLADWNRMIAVNLTGVFLCTQAVLPGMLARQHGAIINIASRAAQLGVPRLAHYAASKGGVVAFTRSVAREVGTQGVRVNCIAPGPLRTDLLAERARDPVWAEAKLSAQVLKRFAEADEVAATAVFLASPASSLYIGQTLSPNGGGVM